jgi:hypothetical protein
MGQPTARLRTIGSSSDSGNLADNVQVLDFDAVDQYAAMVDAFARTVSAGVLVGPGEDGLAQMRVLDQIIAAARAVGANP